MALLPKIVSVGGSRSWLLLCRTPCFQARSMTSGKDTDKKGPQQTKAPEPKSPPKEDSSGNTYKVKEYYTNNTYSFYKMEHDMEKQRIGQPSSLK
ncbi:uncharacterized protein LOC106163602 [Lingula anatina]|uniref:Uncharacterized protein LOC106163602 n=1 Tax=Lingula anatina TaxID=7574 RepID=A0A1S3IFQ1_LINAN|nr:uncharacterized protein LOC106163602 [Lingula anatina]|eukprot:XP_013396696.1 uncharacterized protein LOC106163602 [Lingula anatina]